MAIDAAMRVQNHVDAFALLFLVGHLVFVLRRAFVHPGDDALDMLQVFGFQIRGAFRDAQESDCS